ncbi:MAG: hypothetical protein Q9157_000608, partial [Trypethelium eluteriae]
SETYYITELFIVSVVQGTGAVYTTVDGIPRASGIFTPTATSVFTTAATLSQVFPGSESRPMNVSAPPSPTCTLWLSDCRALYTSYFSSLRINPNATIVSSITPVPTNSPPCDAAFDVQPNEPGTTFSNPIEPPGSCTLYGQNVQLCFFPPATQQSNSTDTKMVVQAFAPGVTFTSPSVYLSFDALSAISTYYGTENTNCSSYPDGISRDVNMNGGGVAFSSVGKTHRDVLLTLKPEDVSSKVIDLPESQTASIISALASGGSDYSYWASQISSAQYNGDYAYQRITLTDLIHPPNSAYYLQGLGPPGCDLPPVWDGLADVPIPVPIQPECQTVFEGLYKAQLSLPSQLLSSDQSSPEPSKSSGGSRRHDSKPASTDEPGSQPRPSASLIVSLNNVRPSDSRITGPVSASNLPGLSGAVGPVASHDANSDAGISFDPMIASIVSGSADQEGGDRGPGGGGVVAGQDSGSTEDDNRYGTSDNEALSSSQEVTVGIGGQPMTAAFHTNAAVVDGHTLKMGDSDVMIDGHTVSAADKGVLIDGSITLYPPVVSSAPSTARTAGVNIDGTQYTAASQNGAILIGSKTISVGGAPAIIGGHIVSAAAKGAVVDGTTGPFSQAASPTVDRAKIAELAINDKPYTVSWRPSAVVVGTNTLSPGGAAAVIHGQTMSAASSGIVMDGSTESYSAQGSSVTEASELAHRVILTVGDKPVTASEENDAFVVSGSTLRVGNSPVTIEGAAISVGSSGVVVGANSLPFEALGLAPPTADELKSGQTTVKTGSSSYQISEAPNGQYVVLDGSITLSAGGPATMIDGQMVSAYPGSVKIGSSFTNPGAPVFTEDGHIFTVSPEAGDAKIMVVDGSISLTVDGAASMIDGEKLSAVSGGVVAGSFTVSLDTGSTMAVNPGISSSPVSPQVGSPGEGTSPFSGAKRIIGSLFAALFCSCIGTVLAAVF